MAKQHDHRQAEPVPTTTTTVVSGVIAAGTSLSGPINCKAGTPLRIYAPAQWTGDAPLSFQVSEDGITFADVFDRNGFEVTAVVVPGAAVVSISNDIALSNSFLQLRSGSRANPAVQDNDCTFAIVLG